MLIKIQETATKWLAHNMPVRHVFKYLSPETKKRMLYRMTHCLCSHDRYLIKESSEVNNVSNQ